jgi:succinyl-CoA synthetase beta subunit
VEMRNRDEGLISADNAVQLDSHAKTNSAKIMELRDKNEENARTSNVGKCVAGDAVFS